MDTVFPTAKIAADYTQFSPEGDGRKDTIRVVQDTSNEKLWEGTILKDKNVEMKNFTWQGKAAHFEWDGKDSSKRVVPDGNYRYRVSAQDAAGNGLTQEIANIIDHFQHLVQRLG